MGIPRCGTTLLATFLNAQAGCRFIREYVPAIHALADYWRVTWQQRLSSSQRRAALAVVREEMLRIRHVLAVQRDAFDTLEGLHEQVLSDLAAPADQVVGHKCVISADQIRQMLEETDITCILMYRDPRDAALSFWHRTGGGVESYLADWKARIRLMHDLASHPRFHSIRYEALIRDPRSALAPLEKAWDVHFDFENVRLLEGYGSHQRSRAWTSNSVFDDVRVPFARAPVERWRQHLDSSIVKYASVTCASQIRRLDYSATTKGCITLAQRLALRKHALVSAADRGLMNLAKGGSRMLRAKLAPPLQHTEAPRGTME